MFVDTMLSRLRDRAAEIMEPVARRLTAAGISPNALTFLGLLAGLVSAIFFARGSQVLGGVSLLICGGIDALDGAVARVARRATAFGGVLDSTVDRYVDFLVLAAVAYAGLAEVGYLPGWMWVVLAITGCLLVSYVRARSEAAGSGRLDVGVAERGERLLILAGGGMVGLIGYAVVAIAVLTHLTVIQRLVVARSRLKG
jgi:archaetidylinositol phosphate synthase